MDDLFVGLPPPDPRKIAWTHDIARAKLYDQLGDQLDRLFRDIDAGLFGEAVKTGEFYQHIKTVKDTHAKGSIYRPYADLPPLPGSSE
jgi:hypothetical protein